MPRDVSPDASGAARRLGLLALRVVAGTALFTIVLIAVQSSDPWIAGMMMAFPAVNGISLLMAPVPDKTAMARAMLPVIALNGWMAMAFIGAVAALVQTNEQHASNGILVLSICSFAAWIAVITVFSRAPAGTDRQFLRVFLIACPFLIWLWWNCAPPGGINSGKFVAMPQTQTWRIGLFAVTLTLLLLVAELRSGAHAVLGRLGAFPLLPLFSLATIARSGASPHDGLQRLMDVRPAFLVGILIAMVFALVFARFLDTGQERPAKPRSKWLVGTAGLLAGWLICGGAIWMLGRALVLIQARIAIPGCN